MFLQRFVRSYYEVRKFNIYIELKFLGFEDGLLLENEDVIEYVVRTYTPCITSYKKIVIPTNRDVHTFT